MVWTYKLVCECCLTPNEHIYLCHGESMLQSMKWWWCPPYNRPKRFKIEIFTVLVDWNNNPRVDMSLHSDHWNNNPRVDMSLHSDHWNNNPRVDMSLHSDTLSWFRADQVFALTSLSCVLSGEATHTNFIVSGLTWPGPEPTIYSTRGEQSIHYNTDAVLNK